MFKRSTKITSLLVAAASVASMVPAYAADYKKVDTQEGQIYSAQAYKDGVAVIDGDAKDNDNDAVYYLKDGKYNELEDLNTGDDFDGVTAEKYLDIEDGDNYVDLTSGKVTDEDIKEDNLDDASAALKKKVKSDNDGRYAKENENGAYGSEVTPSLSKSNILAGQKFGKTWYETQYAAKNTTDAQVDAYTVYTDADGKYIDADYNLGKIKVETAGGSVTLKNTDADEISSEDDTKATVTTSNVIGQDKDNIYRLATITVTNDNRAIKKINGLDCTTSGSVFVKEDSGKKVSFPVIQKISKDQASDDVDGIKYAKKTDTYIISQDDATPYDGDKDALLNNASTAYTIANGKVIVYNESLHSVATMDLKSKSAYYYTDLGSVNDDDIQVLDTDVDGNLWMLNDGFVYEFDNDEDWNKVYKVDGAMSHMSVYDKNNAVVWSDEDDDDEVFSVIGSKAKDDDNTTGTTTTTTTTTTAAAGWVQNTTDGTWTYVNTDGTKKTGWFQDTNATWYYLGADGVMKTGWYQDTTGTWYYSNESGAMLHDTTVGGYTLGSNGAWVQ